MEKVAYDGKLNIGHKVLSFRKISNELFYSLLMDDGKCYIIIYNDNLKTITYHLSPVKDFNLTINMVGDIFLIYQKQILSFITKDFSDFKIPNIKVNIETIKTSYKINDTIIIFKKTFSDTYKTLIYTSDNLYDWKLIGKFKEYIVSFTGTVWMDKPYMDVVKDGLHYILLCNMLFIFDNDAKLLKSLTNINTNKINDTTYLIYNFDNKDFLTIS